MARSRTDFSIKETRQGNRENFQLKRRFVIGNTLKAIVELIIHEAVVSTRSSLAAAIRSSLIITRWTRDDSIETPRGFSAIRFGSEIVRGFSKNPYTDWHLAAVGARNFSIRNFPVPSRRREKGRTIVTRGKNNEVGGEGCRSRGLSATASAAEAASISG